MGNPLFDLAELDRLDLLLLRVVHNISNVGYQKPCVTSLNTTHLGESIGFIFCLNIVAAISGIPFIFTPPPLPLFGSLTTGVGGKYRRVWQDHNYMTFSARRRRENFQNEHCFRRFPLKTSIFEYPAEIFCSKQNQPKYVVAKFQISRSPRISWQGGGEVKLQGEVNIDEIPLIVCSLGRPQYFIESEFLETHYVAPH